MIRRGTMVLLGLLVVLRGTALAGGPLVFSTDGGFVRWNTAEPVRYTPDKGGLGVLSNESAVQTVEILFKEWEKVSTATITFKRDGFIAVDVDETNFGPFLGPFGGFLTPRGESVIVFDEDGAIFDELYGLGTGVLGFANPVFFSDGTTTVPVGDPVPPGAEIVEALAFLNGKWIDGINDPGSGNRELSLEEFKAVFVHEFGHFAGLHHTQIHGLSHPPDSDIGGQTTPVETMYPFIFGSSQISLERDDEVSLSLLYPSADFATTTGRITGRVLGPSGAPLSGINVIAKNLADDTDAVSWASGMTGVPTGTFVLAGLTPGQSYTVEVQEIDAFATGGSRIGPFSPPPAMPGPPELYNGAAESVDPAIDDPTSATAIVAAAGVVESGVDIALNIQSFTVTNVALEPQTQIQSFAIGTFDADAIPDFVAPQLGFAPGSLVRFYRGLGDGTFASPVMIDTFPDNVHAVAGHFNSGIDAFLDVAVATGILKQEVRVYLGDGSGGFGPPTSVLNPLDDSSKRLVDLVAGNVNGDAFTDLVTLIRDFTAGTATVYALLGSASGAFTTVTTAVGAGSSVPFGDLRMGDVTGSAAADVVGIASTMPAVIGVLVGDGAGGFTVTQTPIPSISGRIGDFGRGVAVGNFDETGTDDIAVSDLGPTGGQPNFTRSFIDVLASDGVGGLTLADRYAVPESFQPALLAVDLDTDGHLDLASTGGSFGRGDPGAKATVAFGDGTGTFDDVTTIWGLAEFPQVIAAADLNGDGGVDLLVSDSKTGAFGLDPAASYSVLLQNLCGNGDLDGSEACDDGDLTHGDGCDGNCTVTACGNGVLTIGEECDDGNADPADGCTNDCTVCGNGIVTAPEECDDGNLDAGDCCSTSCTVSNVGTACTDPDAPPCTISRCDGLGVCASTPSLPRPGCTAPAVANKAFIRIKDKDGDARDRLLWKWIKGPVTPRSEFGHPRDATSYELCIYDAANTLLAGAAAPAGGICGAKRPLDCWRETKRGFKYVDKDFTSYGLQKIDLREGLEDGKARIIVQGRGVNLSLPSLPIAAPPVTVQLANGDGTCWEASYESLIRHNGPEEFEAKAD